MKENEQRCRLCAYAGTDTNPIRPNGFCEDAVACWERIGEKQEDSDNDASAA